MNRTQSPNTRSKLTQEQAGTIRERAAAGTLQKTLAVPYKVSATVVSQIVDGTEVAGRFVASFKKSWQALYSLAGLDWGRAKGLTWHTTRHQFISRVAETTKNPKDAQEAARHKRLETTQRYMQTRRDRRWEVAHGLNR